MPAWNVSRNSKSKDALRFLISMLLFAFGIFLYVAAASDATSDATSAASVSIAASVTQVLYTVSVAASVTQVLSTVSVAAAYVETEAAKL